MTEKSSPSSHMSQGQALTHVLLLGDKYKHILNEEITHKIALDSLMQDKRLSDDLYDFISREISGKSIRQFFHLVEAYKTQQKALKESLNSSSKAPGAVGWVPKLYQPPTPRPKGILNPLG